MFVPDVLARVEQRNDSLCLGVNALSSVEFVVIALLARQRQIVQVVRTASTLWHDVFDGVGDGRMIFAAQAVFAESACATGNGLTVGTRDTRSTHGEPV
jgi:hypothetical protein